METFFDLINRYSQFLLFYIPLGFIGVWRWSVWIIRKSISFFYREPKGFYQATLSIITPVYNEDPEMFQLALYSWEANKPDEIIAVIDHTDKSSIKIFKKFSKGFPGAKLIITKKPGKRPALADGMRASKSEIVALVDSDTIWDADIKDKLLGTFADPEVGGLVTRQDIIQPNTLARKLFKILLDDRYLFEYAFLATVSDAILCLSGRTAVYRKEAIIDDLDKLENETFWGKKMISGDDKTLTNLVHAKGWKTRYLKSVKVYTNGNPSIRGFLKQKLRWTRNGLRSDSRVLLSGWVWKKHKMLAFHMLDKLVSPLTLLLGLAYFLISLYIGHWQIALIIAGWWLFSRIVKIFPHLQERPRDVLILPVYVVMTFIVAILKIYALMTIDKQGWITRWDKKRLKRFSFIESTLSFASTSAVVVALFFVVSVYKDSAIGMTQIKKMQAQEHTTKTSVSDIFTFDKLRPSIDELEKIKTDLVKGNQSDPFGYYIVKNGDTLPVIRRRFNLAPTGKILDAKTKEPLGRLAILSVGQQVAIPVEDLRNPLSNAAVPNIFTKPLRVTYDVQSNTIFVKQAWSITTLTKISRSLRYADRKLLEQIAPGEWILRANLYIGKDVTLILDGKEVQYLKLKSEDSGFVWLRSESGNILISQTKISSWDEASGAPDTNHENGRSYVTTKNDGRMDIIDSELSHLGYAGLPKRGGLFGGSYGVSWKLKGKSFRDRLLTGVVRGNSFHDNYFGAYTYGTTGMLFQENQFYSNIEYGLDPHDDSNNMLIEKNKAFMNGSHGIIVSKRCFNNTISNNISFENKLHGIMLDRESNNNLVQGNTTYGNTDGITIYQSSRNIILENKIYDNAIGIRLNVDSQENFIENNAITGNRRGAYIYGKSNGNIFLANDIRDSEIGITLKGASRNILLGNLKLIDSTNKKDGRVTTDSYENNIQ